MTLSSLSWLLLALQIALFAATAFVAPIVVHPRLLRYCVYSITSAAAWLAYAVAAVRFDWSVNNDVPGVAYLLVGLIAWLIGSFIFGVRAWRTKHKNAS